MKNKITPEDTKAAEEIFDKFDKLLPEEMAQIVADARPEPEKDADVLLAGVKGFEKLQKTSHSEPSPYACCSCCKRIINWDGFMGVSSGDGVLGRLPRQLCNECSVIPAELETFQGTKSSPDVEAWAKEVSYHLVQPPPDPYKFTAEKYRQERERWEEDRSRVEATLKEFTPRHLTPTPKESVNG